MSALSSGMSEVDGAKFEQYLLVAIIKYINSHQEVLLNYYSVLYDIYWVRV